MPTALAIANAVDTRVKHGMFKPLPFAAEQNCYNLQHGSALGDAHRARGLPLVHSDGVDDGLSVASELTLQGSTWRRAGRVWPKTKMPASSGSFEFSKSDLPSPSLSQASPVSRCFRYPVAAADFATAAVLFIM